MAKPSGTSSRRSANGNPSSLTSLLSPAYISALNQAADVELARLAEAQKLGKLYRPYNPVWDAPTVRKKHEPVSDLRRFYPSDIMRPAHAFKREAAQLVARGKSRVGFRIPGNVALCLRRKARREVLFAFGLTRKSGKGGGKRRRNEYSGVRC